MLRQYFTCIIDTSAWVTWFDRPNAVKDKVKLPTRIDKARYEAEYRFFELLVNMVNAVNVVNMVNIIKA